MLFENIILNPAICKKIYFSLVKLNNLSVLKEKNLFTNYNVLYFAKNSIHECKILHTDKQ